jgi:hypothetical protein
MYEILIRIEDQINEFTIQELKDLKEVLEFFKDYDELRMKYVEENNHKNKK